MALGVELEPAQAVFATAAASLRGSKGAGSAGSGAFHKELQSKGVDVGDPAAVARAKGIGRAKAAGQYIWSQKTKSAPLAWLEEQGPGRKKWAKAVQYLQALDCELPPDKTGGELQKMVMDAGNNLKKKQLAQAVVQAAAAAEAAAAGGVLMR